MKYIIWSLSGRIAALNMLGQEVEIESVPYFWTALSGKNVRYAGKEQPWYCLVYCVNFILWPRHVVFAY